MFCRNCSIFSRNFRPSSVDPKFSLFLFLLLPKFILLGASGIESDKESGIFKLGIVRVVAGKKRKKGI